MTDVDDDELIALGSLIGMARKHLAGTGLDSLTDEEVVALVAELSDVEGDPQEPRRLGIVVADAAKSRGRDIYLALIGRGPTAVKAFRDDMVAFEGRLREWPWGAALEGLDMMRIAATEGADAHYRQHWRDAGSGDDFRWEALVRLHRRGLMIAAEVSALLRAGFPTGAHARWRSLHEVSLLAFLLMDGDEDLAERYLCHQAIQAAEALRLILDHAARYPDEVPSRRSRGEIWAEERRLKDRYGKEYAGRYGWASKHLGQRNPSLKDIAKKVSMSHWAPYVRLADYAVHALSRSVHWDLGEPTPDLPRVGATNYGLEEAGQGTGFSLAAAIVAFLLCRGDLDSLAGAHALHLLSGDVADRFVAAAREQRKSIEGKHTRRAQARLRAASAREGSRVRRSPIRRRPRGAS